MPIASPEVYAEMLDRAKAGAFAYPAINVTSSQTLNAALQGFAEADSDGIVQVSTGGAEYLSGPTVKDMVTGSVAFAAFATEVAKNYPVNIALHTDHCPKNKLDGFVRPLLAISKERVASGEAPLFQSHMWDGSAVPLDENLQIAEELLADGRRRAHRPGDRGRRRRRRGGRRRRRDRREALLHRRGRPGHGRRARPGREGPLHGRPDLRQRARRLQAGQRQAAPGDPQGDPGRGRRQVRQGEAVRPGLPRRLRLAAVGDPRRARLRRGQDEHRHRHAVRVHPPGRRPHVHATTTACSRSTARSATRRRTTRAPGASRPRTAWPSASSRRASTCARPAPPSRSNHALSVERPVPVAGTGRVSCCRVT